MSAPLKVLLGVAVAVIVVAAGALIYSAIDGGKVKDDPTAGDARRAHLAALEAEARAARKQRRLAARAKREAGEIQEASAGRNGTPGQSEANSGGASASSFSQLESEISGEIG